jgi:hypothetical protein
MLFACSAWLGNRPIVLQLLWTTSTLTSEEWCGLALTATYAPIWLMSKFTLWNTDKVFCLSTRTAAETASTSLARHSTLLFTHSFVCASLVLYLNSCINM